MIFSRMIIASLLSSLLCAVAYAGELPAKKQTTLGLYLTALEAYDVKTSGSDVLFIDVRSRAEIAFLGMPTVADANIPYMTASDWLDWDEKKGTYKLAPNSDFLTAVEELVSKRGLTKESRIIIMCRSGSRSAKAVNLMAQAGYRNVYTVTDGYEGDKANSGEQKGQRVVNGWRNNHLPWSYKLNREKMYHLDI